jgi:hypothetical protein
MAKTPGAPHAFRAKNPGGFFVHGVSERNSPAKKPGGTHAFRAKNPEVQVISVQGVSERNSPAKKTGGFFCTLP